MPCHFFRAALVLRRGLVIELNVPLKNMCVRGGGRGREMAVGEELWLWECESGLEVTPCIPSMLDTFAKAVGVTTLLCRSWRSVSLSGNDTFSDAKGFTEVNPPEFMSQEC